MICSLSLKSLCFDRLMSLSIMMAMTAIIAPLLLLFSLRYGIITKAEHDLENNPNNLEIKMLSGYVLEESFFKDMQKDPHVGFIIELTRALSLTCDIKSAHKFKANIEAVPTKEGDPLVSFSRINHILGAHEAFITRALALDLKLKVGDEIKVAISRVINNQRQSSTESFKVSGILSQAVSSRPLIYLPLEVILAMEDYRDGYEPRYFSDGSNLNYNRKSFARARIYAKSLDDVIPLASKLREHFNIRDESAAIENVKAIARVLNIIFGIIAVVTITGGAVTLAGLIFSNISRQHKSLALLRLMGFNSLKIILFVCMQNLILALGAFLFALVLFYAGMSIFNFYFSVNLEPGESVSTLRLVHLLAAFILTALLVLAISFLSVRFKILKTEIASTLRED